MGGVVRLDPAVLHAATNKYEQFIDRFTTQHHTISAHASEVFRGNWHGVAASGQQRLFDEWLRSFTIIITNLTTMQTLLAKSHTDLTGTEQANTAAVSHVFDFTDLTTRHD